MDSWVDVSQVVGVVALIVAIGIGVYYTYRDPVEVLKLAMVDFGLVALARRRDFLDHVYLSAPSHDAPDFNALETAASMPATSWEKYRFALYMPPIADIDQPSDTGLSLSVVWVHRMDA